MSSSNTSPMMRLDGYIKKVTGHYDQYVHHYFGDDHQVVVPNPPLKDDPKVIDF